MILEVPAALQTKKKRNKKEVLTTDSLGRNAHLEHQMFFENRAMWLLIGSQGLKQNAKCQAF